MKNEHQNKLVINKKLRQFSSTNKSSIEGNKTTISNGNRNSFDNTINFYFFSKKIIKRNLKKKI